MNYSPLVSVSFLAEVEICDGTEEKCVAQTMSPSVPVEGQEIYLSALPLEGSFKVRKVIHMFSGFGRDSGKTDSYHTAEVYLDKIE